MNLKACTIIGILAMAAPALAQNSDGGTPSAPPATATQPASEAAPAPNEVKPVASPIAQPPEGKGQVVFFRSPTIMGGAISCAVHENGTKLSSLPRGRYTVIATEPGIHSFSVKSEATDTLRMEIEAGETYYAQCSIGMGFMVGRPNLSPSDQAAFAAMSGRLKPVEIQ